MAENHSAIVQDNSSSPRQKLVSRYKSFRLLESDTPLLAQLPEYQREILRAQGSYEEIGRQFNLPSGTVRSRLHRARAALTKLRASGSEPEQDRQTSH